MDRNEGFNREETGEGVAFLIGELAAETIGAEDSLTLRLGHLAKITEGSCDQAATVFGETAKLLHGPADLLTLRRREMRHGFVVLDDAAALLGRHVVKLGEAVEHALLCLGGKVAEAGFLLQGSLLIGERQIAMTVHPLGEVLLVLLLGAGSSVW